MECICPSHRTDSTKFHENFAQGQLKGIMTSAKTQIGAKSAGFTPVGIIVSL
jgi:hypothetical protein